MGQECFSIGQDWDSLTHFAMPTSFSLTSCTLPSFQFHNICKVFSMYRSLYWVLKLLKYIKIYFWYQAPHRLLEKTKHICNLKIPYDKSLTVSQVWDLISCHMAGLQNFKTSSALSHEQFIRFHWALVCLHVKWRQE